MAEEIAGEDRESGINPEIESRFMEINNIKIYKEIRKMEKLGEKKLRLLLVNLKGKSGKELGQLTKKINKMTDLYKNVVRKLMKRAKKLAEFSEDLEMKEPADYDFYEMVMKNIIILKNFESTYRCFVLELMYKNQEIKAYKQKKEIKELKKAIMNK
ncbi:hypothetical protein [Sebaldella sp. S0638]|uniref:hypothetical protein n=1 Tax=Sebaldella sp. S0638 TaxID=2957809 RepID=UPI0020A116A3|nr:hypothetical protein [Sebaldella sp. S0638]MCP1224302.1 hypothetical protein [Sebaldella sp. S0638]